MRRKGEITGLMNEQDFPHIVELALPPSGFRKRILEFAAFHDDHGLPVRRGRGGNEAEQFYVRFGFPEAADAFRDGFGGGARKSGPRAHSRNGSTEPGSGK